MGHSRARPRVFEHARVQMEVELDRRAGDTTTGSVPSSCWLGGARGRRRQGDADGDPERPAGLAPRPPPLPMNAPFREPAPTP